MEPRPLLLFARRALSSAVLMSWLVTALRLGNVVFVLPVMLRTLPSEELGLWFVLVNAAHFFVFLEMSFQFTLSRAASYLFAGAHDIAALGISPPPAEAAGPNWFQLRGLLHVGGRLYRVLALLIGAFTILVAGGWLAWTRPGEFLRPASLVTFLLLCFSGPLGLAGLHWNAFLSGLNRVREAQAIQLRALAANYLVAFTGLMAGAGMASLALAQVVMIVISRLESRRLVLKEFPELRRAAAEVSFPWRRLWPATWRTGAVQLGSYLALPASLLICGQTLDLRTTASFGLSMQSALMLHGVSAIWLTVKYPLLGQWLATGRKAEVRALFRTRCTLAMATFLAGALFIVLLGPWMLGLLGSKTPLLPEGQLASLLAITALDLFIALWASLILVANRASHLSALVVAGVINLALGTWWAQVAGVPGLLAAAAIGLTLLHAWRTPLQAWRLVHDKPATGG